MKIKINPPFIKLEQFLKFAGITETGGQAKQLILNEQVFLNNEICVQRGKKLYENDVIKVFGLPYEYKCIF
ncbi:MAG: RNA-binding S4 domain-containing protein [Eubacterium sp.]|jgi:ribosome-associated protein|nr:RNA-binding S4 domain-containing protein [Eubacterium sp.]